jgi:hypothetical protein
MKRRARYVCVPTKYGLFNVIDTTSGGPAEIAVTTVLLTRREAHHLCALLNSLPSDGPDPEG